MNLILEEPSFVKYDGTKQIVWDASSLEAFKRCPRYYQIRYLQNWRRGSGNIRLAFGSALHAGLEAYDAAVLEKASFNAAVEAGIRGALTGDGDWVEIIKASEDSKRNPFAVARAITWYADQFYGQDSITTATLDDGAPAIEVRFEVPVPGTEYRFSGRVDKIAYFEGNLYFIERKTTDSTISNYFFDRYNPSIQISAYTWALREVLGLPVVGGILEAHQTMVNGSRCVRNLAPRTDEQLEEWLHDAAFYIDMAEKMHDAQYWPMNEAGCGAYGGCELRSVCAAPASQRRFILEDSFAQIERKR